MTATEPSPAPQPIAQGRPFLCQRCNKTLGFRCTGGLRTPAITLRPRQFFVCNNCRYEYRSVALAFAEMDATERKKADEEKKAAEAAKAAAIAEQRKELQAKAQESAKKGKPR